MPLSAKDVIEKYNVKLIEILPLENPIFFGMMTEAKLFHLGTDASISQEPTRAKKVTFYLQHAFSVQPDEDLPKLCEVMNKSKIPGLVNLADQIIAETEPVGNMPLSAKDVIEKYNVKLMEKLPLENPIFFGMMTEAKLFHLGTGASISEEPTRAKKVTFYLQHAFSVQPDEDLPKLCAVMNKSKIPGLIKLADEIKAETEPVESSQGTMNDRRRSYSGDDAKSSESTEPKKQKTDGEFDCIATSKKLRNQFDDKLKTLSYDNMAASLYANEVITTDERTKINSKIGSEKMECLIIEIIIPSLKKGNRKKYKTFLEVMEKNEDSDLQETAKKLGGSKSVPDDPVD